MNHLRQKLHAILFVKLKPRTMVIIFIALVILLIPFIYKAQSSWQRREQRRRQTIFLAIVESYAKYRQRWMENDERVRNMGLPSPDKGLLEFLPSGLRENLELTETWVAPNRRQSLVIVNAPDSITDTG